MSTTAVLVPTAMKTSWQKLRGVFSAAIAIALSGTLLLVLDLLRNFAGESVAIGFSALVVVVLVTCLIVVWAGMRRR
jgi:hypothetical protein